MGVWRTVFLVSRELRVEEALEKGDLDLVIDRRDPGGEPRCSFSLLLLGPGAHLALENCLASLHLNGDVVCVDRRGANQRILDLLLQISGRACGFTTIKLLTPLAPQSDRTARSASSL